MADEFILETKDLTKKFGSFTAVDHVNMHVKRGEVYGFVGENGAGKTTCMKIFAGLSKQTAGNVSLLGCPDTRNAGGHIFGRVGTLIEAPGMYPNLSGYENLKLLAKGIGNYSDKRIKDLLEFVHITDAAKKNTKGYSLGMRQRLGIAIALLAEPELLILDEPVNGLDPQGVADVRHTLRTLCTERGISILISSHLLSELEKVVDTIGIIHKGKLLREVSADSYASESGTSIRIATPNQTEAIQLLRDELHFNPELSDKGEIILKNNTMPFGELIQKLVYGNIYINAIEEQKFSLEELYFSLTGSGRG